MHRAQSSTSDPGHGDTELQSLYLEVASLRLHRNHICISTHSEIKGSRWQLSCDKYTGHNYSTPATEVIFWDYFF